MPISAPHGPNLRRDGGCTWTELGEVPVPEGTNLGSFHEPHVVELPDGRHLGAIRAQGDNIPHKQTTYTTFSADGGLT